MTDDQIVVDEMNACIRQVIDGLPEDHRAALVLHDLEGLTAQQIADICGCSLATAKVRIHRARARLKDALRLECEFYRDGDHVFRCDRKPDEPVE
jgi:RNA polymerase sigma-70 factor (ECF subfamily)